MGIPLRQFPRRESKVLWCEGVMQPLISHESPSLNRRNAFSRRGSVPNTIGWSQSSAEPPDNVTGNLSTDELYDEEDILLEEEREASPESQNDTQLGADVPMDLFPLQSQMSDLVYDFPTFLDLMAQGRGYTRRIPPRALDSAQMRDFRARISRIVNRDPIFTTLPSIQGDHSEPEDLSQETAPSEDEDEDEDGSNSLGELNSDSHHPPMRLPEPTGRRYRAQTLPRRPETRRTDADLLPFFQYIYRDIRRL